MPDSKSQNSLEDSMKDFSLKLYESLSKEIRELERNFISLIVPFITALAVYGVGLKEYLTQSSEQNFIFFNVTTIAFLILIIIIWCVSNIFGYTHRSNQIILSKIEKMACLYDSKIIPKSWNLHEKLVRCEFTDPPEIYKLFKLFSFITGILGVFIYLTIVFEFHKEISLKLIFVLVIALLILIPITKCRWNYFRFEMAFYSKKLKELAIEIDEKLSCQKENNEKDINQKKDEQETNQ